MTLHVDTAKAINCDHAACMACKVQVVRKQNARAFEGPAVGAMTYV